MHATTTMIPTEGAKLKLVEAAECLFAERGFEAVSVRDITRAAGTNVAAVNYHFGSRDGLVAVVMARYILPVMDERLARLDQAERDRAGKALPVEEILEALVRPLVTQVRRSDHSEKLFCKLLGRLFSLHDQAMPPELEARFSQIMTRFMRAVGKSLPTLDPETVAWRLHFVSGGMIHLLSHVDKLQRFSHGQSGAPSFEKTLTRFIRFAAAGMREGVAEEDDLGKGPQAVFDF